MKPHVVGIFGPFNAHALVAMSADQAKKLVEDGEIDPAPAYVVEGVKGDLDRLGKLDRDLAGSGLAMSCLALAFEMSNPYNSATSKAQSAKVLADSLGELRELAPPPREKDRIDEVSEKREERRRGSAEA